MISRRDLHQKKGLRSVSHRQCGSWHVECNMCAPPQDVAEHENFSFNGMKLYFMRLESGVVLVIWIKVRSTSKRNRIR